MKITKNFLKQVIKEELSKMEEVDGQPSGDSSKPTTIPKTKEELLSRYNELGFKKQPQDVNIRIDESIAEVTFTKPRPKGGVVAVRLAYKIGSSGKPYADLYVSNAVDEESVKILASLLKEVVAGSGA